MMICTMHAGTKSRNMHAGANTRNIHAGTMGEQVSMGMKLDRIKKMEQYILEHDLVSMEELRDTFGISMNTVRLDVAHLVSKGEIRKVYGGVCSIQKDSPIPYEERQSRSAEEKRIVGRAAAALVEDGDILFIDSGTTTMHMVDFLGERKNVTILTNSLDVIIHAQPLPELHVIVLPGTLDRKTNSFGSAETVRSLEKYNLGKAFMASSGVSETGMVTNSSPLEFETKKAAIAGSRQVVLLVDASKYGKSAMLTYATLSRMDAVVMNGPVDPGFEALCQQHGVRLVTAEAK